MNGIRAADIAQIHVEPLAVGVKRLFVEPVGPGREEGNPDRSGAASVFCGGVEWETKDVVSLYFISTVRLPRLEESRRRSVAIVIQLHHVPTWRAE